MKKVIIATLKVMIAVLFCMIIFLALSLALCKKAYCGNLYQVKGMIIKADHSANEWEVLDVRQEVWKFTDGEDFLEGDLVDITFFDNDTSSNIKDDIILHLFYFGYAENWKDFSKKI